MWSDLPLPSIPNTLPWELWCESSTACLSTLLSGRDPWLVDTMGRVTQVPGQLNSAALVVPTPRRIGLWDESSGYNREGMMISDSWALRSGHGERTRGLPAPTPDPLTALAHRADSDLRMHSSTVQVRVPSVLDSQNCHMCNGKCRQAVAGDGWPLPPGTGASC